MAPGDTTVGRTPNNVENYMPNNVEIKNSYFGNYFARSFESPGLFLDRPGNWLRVRVGEKRRGSGTPGRRGFVKTSPQT